MIVFNKGRKCKKVDWKWEDNNIEEVDSFKYLGFIFNSKCDFKDHIKELKKKGMYATKKTCRNLGMGRKKRLGENKNRLL